MNTVFYEFLDYNVTAKMVARSAGRALGLLIAKTKAYRGMPYESFTKLYDSLVQPIRDYGASIWGTKEFSCVNAVQNRASHYYMGVQIHTKWCCTWRHGMATSCSQTVDLSNQTGEH